MVPDIKTIILDIDGTLSPEVSWFQLTESLGASKEKHARIFDRFTKNEIDYPTAKGFLIDLWKSTGKATRSEMETIFRSWKLKDDALEIVEYLKQKYDLCLISGSVDLYVQVVAETLGIFDWYANTELVFDERGNLADFHYFRDQAAKKLKHLDEYLSKKGTLKENCAIIGNGDSDIALFNELPYGIAVDTDLHNEVKALASNTVTALTEVKLIL